MCQGQVGLRREQIEIWIAVSQGCGVEVEWGYHRNMPDLGESGHGLEVSFRDRTDDELAAFERTVGNHLPRTVVLAQVYGIDDKMLHQAFLFQLSGSGKNTCVEVSGICIQVIRQPAGIER